MRILKRICLALLGVWATLSVASLASFIYAASGGSLVGELRVKMALEVTILNFPASALVTLLPVPVSGPIGEWCVMTLAGVTQWLLVVPWIAGWIGAKARLRNRYLHSPPT